MTGVSKACREWARAAASEDEIIVVGGYDDGELDTTELFSVSENK